MAETNALPTNITPGTADHATLHNNVNARAAKYGTGSPEGVITAVPGVTYADTDATLGVSTWIKASGTGNTGWKPLIADTGFRSVAGSLINSWTASAAVIRRINNTVELRFISLTGGSAAAVYNLPSGFQPTSSNVRAVFFGADDVATAPVVIGTAITLPAVAAGTFCVTYTTTQAWPTSLPGSAA